MTKVEVLMELERATSERAQRLNESRAAYRQAQENFVKERGRARKIREDANRAFVKVVEKARKTGTPRTEIAKYTGLSLQRLNTLRHATSKQGSK